VFKMYDNESKGMMFPPLQAGNFKDLAGTWRPSLDGGPCIFVLYPEYLTDPMIIFCPSDAELGTSIANAHGPNGEWCVGYSDNGGGDCGRAIDSSYAYLGWVIDQANANAPTTTIGSSSLLSLLSQFLDPNEMPDPTASVPTQFLSTLEAMVTTDTIARATNPSAYPGEYPAADSDVNVGTPLGNGGGSTVYRLREGVERFMITDINNPSGSSKAQSEIFIMFDQLATKSGAFNHVPGGSNVLYMDGHVSFMRYEQFGSAPVNGVMATLVTLVSGG
jgi:prepilin-type processing-associated H-X9-DG protein